QQRRRQKPHTRTPRTNPATPREITVPHSSTSQLPTKSANHIRRIDAISRQGQNAKDGAPVRNHRGLDAEIEQGGLDDGSCDGECACVSADASSCHADYEANDDGEERYEAIGDEAGPERAKEHGKDAYQSKKTDDQG
ncbi:MAG: hypothetical protein Q9180_001216, partial [Flavoplaca navasiana]